METDLNILVIEAEPSILASLKEELKALSFTSYRTCGPEAPADELAARFDVEVGFRYHHALRGIRANTGPTVRPTLIS